MSNEDFPQVLQWINQERAARQWPLLDEIPQGIRCIAGRCPIANALNNEVQVCADSTYWGKAGEDIDNPEFISRFVMNFDAGRYPELEA